MKEDRIQLPDWFNRKSVTYKRHPDAWSIISIVINLIVTFFCLLVIFNKLKEAGLI